MEYTEEELAAAAERFEKWADTIDPKDIRWKDGAPIRAITEATDATPVNEARQREAVQHARAEGFSWGMIAVALGTSAQAARERFEKPQA